MLNYQFWDILNIDELNNLASNGWELFDYNSVDSETQNLKKVILVKGKKEILNSTEEKIIENGNEFIINKTISYGDVIIITFLSIFLVLSIVGFLIKFLVPKLVNFKKH